MANTADMAQRTVRAGANSGDIERIERYGRKEGFLPQRRSWPVSAEHAAAWAIAVTVPARQVDTWLAVRRATRLALVSIIHPDAKHELLDAAESAQHPDAHKSLTDIIEYARHEPGYGAEHFTAIEAWSGGSRLDIIRADGTRLVYVERRSGPAVAVSSLFETIGRVHGDFLDILADIVNASQAAAEREGAWPVSTERLRAALGYATEISDLALASSPKKKKPGEEGGNPPDPASETSLPHVTREESPLTSGKNSACESEQQPLARVPGGQPPWSIVPNGRADPRKPHAAAT